MQGSKEHDLCVILDFDWESNMGLCLLDFDSVWVWEAVRGAS
jgi:hypothetical protein